MEITDGFTESSLSFLMMIVAFFSVTFNIIFTMVVFSSDLIAGDGDTCRVFIMTVFYLIRWTIKGECMKLVRTNFIVSVTSLPIPMKQTSMLTIISNPTWLANSLLL